MKYKFYALICEIQIRKQEKGQTWKLNSVAVSSFELPRKEENLSYIISVKEKRKHPFFREDNCSYILNLRDMYESLSMK